MKTDPLIRQACLRASLRQARDRMARRLGIGVGTARPHKLPQWNRIDLLAIVIGSLAAIGVILAVALVILVFLHS